MRAAALGLLAALSCLPGCSSGDGDVNGTLFLVTGEADTWSASPVPERVQVDLVGTKRTSLATLTAPTSTIDLGAGAAAEALAAFEVNGYDADGAAVVHGKSVTYSITTLANSYPVVFTARTGGLARAPGDLLFEYRHPLVEVVGHAFVLIAGGDTSNAAQNSLDLYDAANWVVAPQQSWLPAVPKSWAISGSNLLIFNDDGATSTDLSTSTVSTLVPPSGLDFATIAGGKTIVATDDTRYIVGATRATGDATASVLRVTSDGTLSTLKLNAPRLGAAAGLVSGQLVVAGGSDSAAGVEILNTAGTAFVALDYPPDAVQGAALAALDGATALLVGGADAGGVSGGLRTLDVSCAAKCTAAPLPDLDFAFSSAQAVALADGTLIISGESDGGQTHLFTFEHGADYVLTELTLRVPRSGASLALFPNGQAGLVGGDAADGSAASKVELYFEP